jgi:serine/threonine protein kinase
MPEALHSLIKDLEQSGIVAPGKLEAFVPPQAHPKTIEELVRSLVKHQHLTKFQAQQVAAGRTKALALGGYTILDKIGAGGMGQVFKAEHRRMKRLVAVKMLPAKTMRDPAAVARFQREVEAAAKLRHPNIVAADDANEVNGVHFLVMEYVEGSDLASVVKSGGPLPVAKAVNYILQAARGLEFAHAEGVVHRDVKPSNFLLDKKGVVKILDMGLARIERLEAGQAELTNTGTVMGTIDYMAPEQAISTKLADARADIYSLGCSLFYLLTGRALYDGETITAKLLAHQKDPIPSLRSACPEVSAELDAIYCQMVAKNAADRQQSMTEVISALERLSSGQPSAISLPAVIEPPPAQTSQFTLGAKFNPGPAHSQKYASARGRGQQTMWIALGAAGVAVAGIAVAVLLSQSGQKSEPPEKQPKAAVQPKDDKTQIKPETPKPVITADRRAAQWVLERGGTVEIIAESLVNQALIDRVEKLPADDFDLVVIHLKKLTLAPDDLEQISKLRHVEWIDLGGSTITGGRLDRLRDLPNLQRLWLINTNVGNEGAKDACRFSSLGFLGLNGTKVDDNVIPEIARLSNLGSIDLRNTMVTAQGEQALRRQLPNCKLMGR